MKLQGRVMAAISSIMRLRLWLLLLSAAVAVVAFLFTPGAWPFTGRILAAWDIAAFLYLGLAWTMLARASIETMQQRAQQEDEGAVVILGLTVAAAVASLGAIGAELAGIHVNEPAGQVIRLALAGITILCSWLFLHTVFAIHYAHEFYGDHGEGSGLAFPGEPKPDYWDFMYFAFTIGSAAQTSDVTVVSRLMRRLVLIHTVLSFLFNTTILALVVNLGAALLWAQRPS